MDDLELFREDKPVGSPGSHQPIIDTSGISIAIIRKWLISLLVGAQRAIKVVVGPSLPYNNLFGNKIIK